MTWTLLPAKKPSNYACLAKRKFLGMTSHFVPYTSPCAITLPIAVQLLVNTIAFGSALQPLVVLTFLVFVGLSFEGVMRTLTVAAECAKANRVRFQMLP